MTQHTCCKCECHQTGRTMWIAQTPKKEEPVVQQEFNWWGLALILAAALAFLVVCGWMIDRGLHDLREFFREDRKP